MQAMVYFPCHMLVYSETTPSKTEAIHARPFVNNM
jgi:hypothetical protein